LRKVLMTLAIALVLAVPLEAFAALQCVTYARETSGINLKGDAWQWWNAAQGVYDRGRTPKEGAVLVFNRQGNMRHGHVSVLKKVVSSRVVLVDHANWAPYRSADRGRVAQAVPVMDVSPNNDWSQVRVWFRPASDYGNRTYHTSGFVYNPAAKVRPASLRSEAQAPAAPHAAPQAAAVQVPVTPAAQPAVQASVAHKQGHEQVKPAEQVKAVEQVKVEQAKSVEQAKALDQVKVEQVKATVQKPAAEPRPAPPGRSADPRAFDPRDWAEQA
jgi:hypothetical protein